MKIQAIKKVNVSEQVFEQMKQLLLNNEWKNGDKIPSEHEMAEMFQVSRITVRNALQKLAALGLIETKLGEGSFVKQISGESVMNSLVATAYLGGQTIIEVLEFRQVVETETAGLAAERAEKTDIEQLRALVEEMSLLKKDPKGLADIDLKFHFKLAEITQNSFVKKTYSILQDVLRASMNEVVGKMGGEMGDYYHNLIIEAIEQRNRIRASELMREHIEKTIEGYKEIEKL